jgi:hypothetical protein
VNYFGLKPMHYEAYSGHLPATLKSSLTAFVSRYGGSDAIIQSDKGAEWAVFYDDTPRMLGLTRIIYDVVESNQKTSVIFTSMTVHHESVNFNLDVAKLVLTYALKYQLKYPTHDIFYLVNAKTQFSCQALVQLNNAFYPLDEAHLPEAIVTWMTCHETYVSAEVLSLQEKTPEDWYVMNTITSV